MDKITITWTCQDIIERGKRNYHNLSKTDASDILRNLQDNYDCNYGITWETIDIETGLFIDRTLDALGMRL